MAPKTQLSAREELIATDEVLNNQSDEKPGAIAEAAMHDRRLELLASSASLEIGAVVPWSIDIGEQFSQQAPLASHPEMDDIDIQVEELPVQVRVVVAAVLGDEVELTEVYEGEVSPDMNIPEPRSIRVPRAMVQEALQSVLA